MSRQPYQFTNEEVPTSELMIGGGVIRFDPTEGIYLHTNKTHHSVGIESVGANADGDLYVKRFSGGAVVSLSASPDETLCARGITAGVSGGGINSVIRLYNRAGKRLNLNNASDYAEIASPTANLWVTYINRMV